MTLLQRVQNKIQTEEHILKYNEEFYEDKMIELGNTILEYINKKDSTLMYIYYRKILIILVQLSNKPLTNINKNFDLCLHLITHKEGTVILNDSRIIFYNFLGTVINLQIMKYNIVMWLKIGELLNIDVKEVLLSILKEE